ncbi:MAG: MazG family protein [Actinomycetota bacterium]
MARLRAPDGCPWDAEQTHESLAIHLLEETYEVLEAIDNSDVHGLQEELGDVLLQVVFHSEIAQETGHFEVGEVIDELIAKLVQRHPHVFADTVAKTSDEVVANWEAIKKKEKSRESIDEGIPKNLPALLLAHKVRRRLSGVGREHVTSQTHLQTLAAGSLDEETIGELLFEAAALAQEQGIDAEAALRKHAARLFREAKDR